MANLRFPARWIIPALLLGLGAEPAFVWAEDFEARYRRALVEEAEHFHFHDEYVRIDDRVAEALERRSAGTSEAEILKGARKAVWDAWFDFAPRGAVHDRSARYRFPFPLWFPALVAQGNFGFRTHGKEPNIHAWDIALAPGTRILAARAGTVVRVRDGFPPGDELPSGLPGKTTTYSNSVYVLHADGTVGIYTHLRKGLVATSGQRVKPGDLLAYAGASGSPEGPHLHFGVIRLDSEGGERSVPARFGRKGGKGFVPKQDDVIGGPPKSTIALRVKYRGESIQPGQTLLLPRGGKEQLVVEAKIGGSYRDVTEAEPVRYHSITPWSVVVNDSGLIHMAHGPGYGNSPDGNRDAGRIMVLYAKPKARQFGHVIFNLRTR